MVYKFANRFFFETRCTKFTSIYIGMCAVYSVYFVCTHYGRKMLAALHGKIDTEKNKKIERKNSYDYNKLATVKQSHFNSLFGCGLK